jgi:hypothetical protein
MTLNPQITQQAGDVFAPAVHDDRLHPNGVEHDDILSKTRFELIAALSGATILDDDDIAVKFFDIGESFEKRLDGLDVLLHGLIPDNVDALSWRVGGILAHYR